MKTVTFQTASLFFACWAQNVSWFVLQFDLIDNTPQKPFTSTNPVIRRKTLKGGTPWQN